MKFLKILMLFLLVGCGAEEDNCSSFTPQASDRYRFPVRPGMPEWGNFNNGQEMIDALQVPKTTLSNMIPSILLNALV